MFVTLRGTIVGFSATGSSGGGGTSGELDFSLADNSSYLAWL
jgi:hypothetical protein